MVVRIRWHPIGNNAPIEKWGSGRFEALVNGSHCEDFREVCAPSLLQYICVQCEQQYTVLVYAGSAGPGLAVIPESQGGLSTPNTPAGVAYYLDQAYRAESVGANSAALAMYRGALEHLLFQQGYKSGMCGAKIKQLEADIQSSTAPKWAIDLETDFLTVMKQLGDGAIHPNDGDITKQSHLDQSLLVHVKETFRALLFVVYEVPLQRKNRLDSLKAKVHLITK
jgi:hypothetical protein